MKIILDESVPQNLRLLIEEGHTVVTTWYQGWSGLKNGTLFYAAEGAGFDLFITAGDGRPVALCAPRAGWLGTPEISHEWSGVVLY